jgi:type I restriction enzyme S subunit
MSPEYQSTLDKMKVGTSDSSVSIGNQQILDLEILVPPIGEQHKIVELLDDHLSRLDAALVDVKQAKINAVQFRRSILQAAFSGKFIQETGYGEANWAISELGELCTFITDGSHNPPKGIEKSEYLMLSSRDINNGELTFDKPRYLSKKDFESENKRTDLQMDDVLLTTVGTIGRTAIYAGVPKNVTFQRSVSVLRPNKLKISSKFLMYFLDSITDLLNREARGVAQQGIYLNQVRKLEIPVPSLEEQLFLVELLDDHLSRLDSSFALADLIENQGAALRRSLLQAAFTGQLTNEVVSV